MIKHGSFLLFLVVAVVAVVFAGAYGYSAGGGDVEVLPKKTDITVEGDVGSLTTIAGDGNITTVEPMPLPVENERPAIVWFVAIGFLLAAFIAVGSFVVWLMWPRERKVIHEYV